MTETTAQNGWTTLDSGFDVELLHGIPIRLSNNGLDIPADDAELAREVSALTGLTVVIKGWKEAEDRGEMETELCIDAMQFEEVLSRLALASAALFVDRYHTPIEKDSVDWDSAEYARDFNHAANWCCLDPGDMNRQDYFKTYVSQMHAETRRLLDSGESPMVEAEDD